MLQTSIVLSEKFIFGFDNKSAKDVDETTSAIFSKLNCATWLRCGFIHSFSFIVVTSSSRSPMVRPTSAPNQKPAISRSSTPATPTSRTAASLDNLTRKRITLDMSNSASRKSEGRLTGRETVNSDSAASSSNESSYKGKELEYRRSSTNYSDKVRLEGTITEIMVLSRLNEIKIC